MALTAYRKYKGIVVTKLRVWPTILALPKVFLIASPLKELFHLDLPDRLILK